MFLVVVDLKKKNSQIYSTKCLAGNKPVLWLLLRSTASRIYIHCLQAIRRQVSVSQVYTIQGMAVEPTVSMQDIASLGETIYFRNSITAYENRHAFVLHEILMA